MSLDLLAEVSGIDLYRKLTKKEQRLFRKFLKKKLGICGSWAQPWFSRVQRLNRRARYSTLNEFDRAYFSMLFPPKIKLENIAFPIRRSLDYQSIARRVFSVEPLSETASVIYNTEVNVL